MTDPNQVVITAAQGVTATCPLGHDWVAIHTTARDRSRTIRQGRRLFYQFHEQVNPERCPTCGNKWGRLIPLPDTRVTA